MGVPADIHFEHPVIVQMRRNNYQKADICRLLNISYPTFNRYLTRPELVRMGDILILAGLFNVPFYELLYKWLHSTNKIKLQERKHVKEIELKFNNKQPLSPFKHNTFRPNNNNKPSKPQ